MKGSEAFKDTIQEYLNSRAKEDPTFDEKLKDEKFKIDKCIGYILKTVRDSGVNGFEDDEVFSMAVHYVDEYLNKDSKESGGGNMSVVVNHTVELTEKEIEEAKEDARNKILDEARTKMTKKPKKKAIVKEEVKESDNQPSQSALLF